MKYEDYETRLNSVVSNPDTAPVTIQEVLAEIKTDLTSLESANTGIAERDERIKSLQDTNIKLFMSQTGEGEAEADPEDWSELEGDEALEAFISAHEKEE